MKELSIRETIEDLRQCIDGLKKQLVYIVNEELNDFVAFRIKYYQNIINWLEELEQIKKFENDDLK